MVIGWFFIAPAVLFKWKQNRLVIGMLFNIQMYELKEENTVSHCYSC